MAGMVDMPAGAGRLMSRVLALDRAGHRHWSRSRSPSASRSPGRYRRRPHHPGAIVLGLESGSVVSGRLKERRR